MHRSVQSAPISTVSVLISTGSALISTGCVLISTCTGSVLISTGSVLISTGSVLISTPVSVQIAHLHAKTETTWNATVGTQILMDFDPDKKRERGSSITTSIVQFHAKANWPDGYRNHTLGRSSFNPGDQTSHDLKRGAVLDMTHGGVPLSAAIALSKHRGWTVNQIYQETTLAQTMSAIQTLQAATSTSSTSK